MSDKKPEAPQTTEQIVPDTPEKIAFVHGLMARGEAAKLDPDGSLPKGATHEIVGEAQNGLPIVRRRRFY
jgi:hypothetical protein